MKQTLDTVWQRRGTSWLWDEEARNLVCTAGEVWSLRQFLRAVGQWPDDLPSNGGNTLVVAGLDGGLDLLSQTMPRAGWAMPSKMPSSASRASTKVKPR